jgi:hypothetical protein
MFEQMILRTMRIVVLAANSTSGDSLPYPPTEKEVQKLEVEKLRGSTSELGRKRERISLILSYSYIFHL